MTLLHDLPDFGDLIEVTARSHAIDPGLVEKDYWIMHGLWGLQQLGFRFELKGGTSLSKGFRLIHRFSEDIDILIHPDGELPTGRNQNKPAHVEARREFYDGLPARLSIPGFGAVERDRNFDGDRMRSAGIRLLYPALSPLPGGVKAGILLEAGFDQVAPNRPCLISSWAYDAAIASGLTDVTDNRAIDVACYEPGYTFVEKLQTISTKFRWYLETGEMPANFLRHYYDVYCLWRIPACRHSSVARPMSRTRRHGFPLPTNR
ncbi:MAG: nucleotidyl transferase AbiEii/AbiGii toxin family protein [Sphingomonadaceae bacterium]